jgi:hypothetical protein
MKAVQEPQIRASFVNCSKGEAGRITLPRDLADRPWDDLDFLGWRDPSALDRSYLVTERDSRLVGVTLRVATGQRGFLRRGMCSLCLTTHPGDGVSLMTGRKAGPSGRNGNSVGLYVCTDLACSLYLRGLKIPEVPRFAESLTVQEQIERTRGKLDAFLDRLFE